MLGRGRDRPILAATIYKVTYDLSGALVVMTDTFMIGGLLLVAVVCMGLWPPSSTSRLQFD